MKTTNPPVHETSFRNTTKIKISTNKDLHYVSREEQFRTLQLFSNFASSIQQLWRLAKSRIAIQVRSTLYTQHFNIFRYWSDQPPTSLPLQHTARTTVLSVNFPKHAHKKNLVPQQPSIPTIQDSKARTTNLVIIIIVQCIFYIITWGKNKKYQNIKIILSSFLSQKSVQLKFW